MILTLTSIDYNIKWELCIREKQVGSNLTFAPMARKVIPKWKASLIALMNGDRQWYNIVVFDNKRWLLDPSEPPICSFQSKEECKTFLSTVYAQLSQEKFNNSITIIDHKY